MTQANFFKALLITFIIITTQSACSQDTQPAEISTAELEGYLEVAEIYRSQGQFNSSIIEIRNALQLIPNHPDAIHLIAQVYMDIGDNEQAILQLNSLANKEVKTNLLLAEAHIRSSRAQEALSILNTLELTSEANQNRSNWLLGNVSAMNENWEQAKTYFNSTLAQDSTNIDTLISLSKIEFQTGNIEEALNLIQQAIASDDDYLDLWIWRAQFAMLQENYPDAENAFLEALDIMSLYDIMTAKKLGALQSIVIPLEMQQKNEEAQRYLEIVQATPYGQFNNSFTSAVQLFEQGDAENAEEVLRELLDTAPDHAATNILLGLTQYSQGDFAGAEELLSNFVGTENSSSQLLKTLAASHLRLNQPDQALSVLEQAQQNDPNDNSIVALISIAQNSLGNFDGSLNILNDSLSTNADSPELHLALANTYVEMENFSAGIEEYNTAISLAPENEQAKTALLALYNNQGQSNQIKSTSEAWLAQDSESIFNNNVAGVLALQAQEFEEARAYFTKIIARESDNTLAQVNLARIDLIEANYPAASRRYEALLEQQPSNPDALSGLLIIGDQTDSQTEQIAKLEKIIIDNPAEFAPALVLSQYFLINNDLPEAKKYAETALANNDNQFTQGAVINVLLREANEQTQASNLDAASNLIDSALEIQENNIQALAEASSASIRKKDFNQAQNYLDRLNELSPNSGLSYELEGNILMAQEEIQAGVEKYQQAWELNNNGAIALKIYQGLANLNQTDAAADFAKKWHEALPDDINVNLILAMDYQAKSLDRQAIEHYEFIYEQQPDNLIALNNLAWMFQDSNPEQALEMAAHAAELAPNNSAILDTYGWILFTQGNSTQAIEVLEKALSISPDATDIQEHLNAARN